MQVQFVIAIVVPCYNEASRWNYDYWHNLTSTDNTCWVFVDDGSFDATSELARKLLSQNVSLMRLDVNKGKAEAIRLGLLTAQSNEFSWIGFLDADASIPVEEVRRVLKLAELSPEGREALWGSRVQLRGRSVHRSVSRHYLGRGVSTLFSMRRSGFPYDSQCGFKLFKNTNELHDSLSSVFKTRWLFDVELFDRLTVSYSNQSDWLWEEPLLSWSEVGDSRITGRESRRILKEIFTIMNLKGRRTSGR